MKPNAGAMPGPTPRSEAEIFRCIRYTMIRSVVERGLEDGWLVKCAGTSGADLNENPEHSQQGNENEQDSQTLAQSVGISSGLANPVATEREHGSGHQRKGQGFKHKHLPPGKPAVGRAVLRCNGMPEIVHQRPRRHAGRLPPYHRDQQRLARPAGHPRDGFLMDEAKRHAPSHRA